MKLLSYEIGSLAKPEWRVKSVAGQPLSQADVEDARAWGKRLGVACEPLVELLQRGKSKGFDTQAKAEVKRWSSLYAIRLLERSGLSVVYDGEQQRSEMYQYPITHSRGFQFRGLVQSFDNKYYQKAACVAPPQVVKPFHVQEFQLAKSQAQNPLKVPVTGAYTLADWSFDEHYAKRSLQIGSATGKARQKEARRRFVLDVARKLVRPNVQALLEAGADWVQIDEPAVTTHPQEIPLFVESFNESVRGLKGRFTIHVCFCDYTLLFPHIERLEHCWGICVGFSNYDTTRPGTDAASRPGFAALRDFARLPLKLHMGVGVLDIHKDLIEPPTLIRDRLLHALELLEPQRVNPCPDCGLRTRSWEIAFQKLCNMAEAIDALN